MTHVITQNCCNDASCVSVCPVDCIHPTPDEPDFRTAEMLYIDPDVCIDCGACVAPCPVSAIYPDYELPEVFAEYEEMNAKFFVNRDSVATAPVTDASHERMWSDTTTETLRVAVVGSGPAAFYAVEELMAQKGLAVEVDMFERLPVPGGLVRYGVAPDHQRTKDILETFDRVMQHRGFRLFGNVEVGRDISHGELASRYHAIVYAVGASGDRSLGIPGEGLPGSHSATAFVAWYNGHPDFGTETFDLSCRRVAIIGNGNVALDVARILTADIEDLRRTDISDVALAALEVSRVEDVVVIGRRGPAEAAFTTPELMGLVALPGIDVVVSSDAGEHGAEPAVGADGFSAGRLKSELLARQSDCEPTGGRRVTLQFLRTPLEVLGHERVEGLRLVRNELVDEAGIAVAQATEEAEDLECGLVLRAVGYRGHPLPGLPYDEVRGTLPEAHGRVIDPHTRRPLVGVYTTGWIKRGPSGVIGTNRQCAKESITSLLDDFAGGLLPEPGLCDDIAIRFPHAVDVEAWRAIDEHERALGRGTSRPRVKLLSRDEMLAVADASRPSLGLTVSAQ